MEITLYTNESEKNKLEKTITNSILLEGNLRDESSIINPIILISSNKEDIPYMYNYAYIPAFGRYYFITDIESVRTGIWRVSMHVDVLMSYKEQIKNLNVIINNSEETGANNYLSGNQWITNVKNTTNIVNFPNGLNDNGEFILITAGG
jgi:hypothetical protein